MRFSLFLGAALFCAPATLLAQDAPPPPPQNDMSAQQMPQGSPATDANAPSEAAPADPSATSNAGAAPDASAPAAPTAPAAPDSAAMTPAPEAKADYPMCSRTVQDSCINPGEAKGRKARRHR